MAEFRGVDVLQSEIEKSKDKLRGYNENIRKLTGRDPSRPGVRRMLSGDRPVEDGYQNRAARGRGRLFGLARRGIMEDTGPPPKRRVMGGAFSRLGPAPMRRRDREDSPYEEELPHKLSVQSSVVATSRDAKNRSEIMQEQTKDKEGMQRNRRMFGLLLGTLNKFKTESKTLETKDVRRKKIEDKLEEKAEKERKKFKQERKLLMEEMHLEQSKISRLEQKMEMVQEHADREAEMLKLKNFIATKAKPRIFWRPVQMTATTEGKMRDSKKFVDDLLQEGKDRLDKEILELMERENKREERIKMRLREDGLLGDNDEEEEENVDKEEDRGQGSGRVVVEAKSESVTSRLGPNVDEDNNEDDDDDDNEEEEDNAEDMKKKTRRTVVVEPEEKETAEDEEEEEDGGVDSTENRKNQDDDEDGEVEEGEADETVTQSEVVEKEAVERAVDDGNDSDAEDVRKVTGKEQPDCDPETTGRKSSVEEEMRRKSSEKREQDQDKSRHRDEKRSRRRDSSDERAGEKSREKEKEKSRDRGRDRSAERNRKRHRHGEDRKTSRRDSRERSRRDEKREHKKEKRSRRASGSDDDRPVVKKEREERGTGKVHKKARGSGESEAEDAVVVKKEIETPRKSKGAGDGNSGNPVRLNDDDEAEQTEERRVVEA